MKIRKHIKGICWFLMIIYLFINTPFVFFHHHHFLVKGETSQSFIADADPKTDLTTFQEHCYLCDFHFITEHHPSFFIFTPWKVEIQQEKSFIKPDFYLHEILLFRLNKDPPLLI